MTDTPTQLDTLLAVTEIERFAIHDGPGIRTTVFLQGCPLSCQWCSNPESRFPQVHLMHNRNRCTGCGMCTAVCLRGCISMKDGVPAFDRGRCVGCGDCAETCLNDAIKYAGHKMSVGQILQKILRDRDYYLDSGGGVTLSGGEVFAQFNGMMALLDACKARGLHTAVETCGEADPRHILFAAPQVDLFLFDVKHTDPATMRKYTGADATTVFTNLRNLAENHPGKTIVRIPVIPSFNFDEAVIGGIFELVRELGIGEAHLLPYHTLGVDKYGRMGLTYLWPEHKILTKQDLMPFKAQGERMGLTVNFG